MIKSTEQRPWTWSELASWIETEGTVSGGVKKDGRAYCNMSVAQTEREVLDSLCSFVRAATGKRCAVHFAKGAAAYYAQWSSKEAIEKVIAETEPYLRTQRKRKQYAKARLTLLSIMTEREQRVRAAASAREAKRMKRLLNTI